MQTDFITMNLKTIKRWTKSIESRYSYAYVNIVRLVILLLLLWFCTRQNTYTNTINNFIYLMKIISFIINIFLNLEFKHINIL